MNRKIISGGGIMRSNQQCPLCQKYNHCASVSKQPCWCMTEHFPKGIFEKLSREQIKKACICKKCLEKFRLQ